MPAFGSEGHIFVELILLDEARQWKNFAKFFEKFKHFGVVPALLKCVLRWVLRLKDDFLLASYYLAILIIKTKL